ncbi:hypothetical protein [Sinomicrobium pectinilyticum]|uniref:hypothetical protein n=1 Tax=Sinomicrobium pectinilyticum TaxID=1084421 RepID=UPI0011CE5C19|nr:hypothetical protein [Sinomicrobium pectinilyticum]
MRTISSASALLKKAGKMGLWRLIFALLFGFISCDSMQSLQGYVVDAETGQPLPGVEYRRYDRKKELRDTIGPYGLIRPPQTDSLGWFSDYKIDNPLWPRMKLRFEKKGYKPVDIKWKPRMDNRDTLKILLKEYSKADE